MEKEYKISWFKVMGIIAFIIIIIALLCLVMPKKSAGASDNILSTYISNINLMKESGFEYFQGSNLPAKVGESKSITLKELIDSKIIMEFHDENNKLCDVNNSYIKTTKTLDNEYAMKVSLSCDNKSDYIVTTITSKNILANNNANVNKTPVTNNIPSNSTGGSVNQVTNVNINYVNSCGANCNTPSCETNCLNNIYYTVNFDTQGGDFVPRQIVKNGDVANYVITKKDGYEFLGWYLNNQEYNFNTPVTKQITLVAEWKKIENNDKPAVNRKFKVYFNSNGGTYVKEQEVLENGYVVRPNDPSKSCYDFAGWYTDSNLTNYYNFNTHVTKDITLFAKWVDNGSCTKKHTVTFNSNGGTNINPQDVLDGKKAEKPINPSKTCYDFGGWYTDSNLTNYYDFKTPVTNDIVLYAKWINNGACINKYTISFNSNGGSYVEDKIVNEGATISRPNNPVRSGYIFKGWYYNGYEFNFNTKINHDYTLVAKWEKELVQYNKYCQVNKERFYSTSYVDGNGKTTYNNWTIKFDNLTNAKNVKITNNGYINSLSMYNDLYYKNSTNKGLSMVGDNGNGHVPYYSAEELQNHSLQNYNFNKYLSNAYYHNGNWYTNASVIVHNYNNVNKYYATHLNKYIYFVPFYFDVEYTNMNLCKWDLASNQYQYDDYQIMDTIYE